MRGWFNDLVIGVRLAVGGGRTSLARLCLSAVGVGIAVAVLLLAASVGPMDDARSERSAARAANTEAVAGVDPLRVISGGTELGDHSIQITYLYPTGPLSPVPPGLPSLPADGEMYVSPALADLLAESAELRGRMAYAQKGLVAANGVVDPADLAAYVGVGPEARSAGTAVYAYGVEPVDRPLDPGLLLLLLLGSTALLVPVFIFVATSTRIAGAERDRRLSALRLVGADSTQVRRIAAAEALVSAVVGLVLGACLFFVGRQAAEGVQLMGISVYPDDMVPSWWLAVLIAVVVPVLAVLTAQFALRRTIIEPLGVVRFSQPVRRRMAWRVATVVTGIGLLLYAAELSANDQLWAWVIATGATLLLVGVPLLLPWLVERAVARVSGGPSSWQLAIRRLQLDSGTSSRVVSGVAVVLAGAIALQSVLLSFADRFEAPLVPTVNGDGRVEIIGTSPAIDRAATDIARAMPSLEMLRHRDVHFQFDEDGSSNLLQVIDCAVIESRLKVTDCADGQYFVPAPYAGERDGFDPGRELRLVEWTGEQTRSYATWKLPQTRREVKDWPRTLPQTLTVPSGLAPAPHGADFSSRIQVPPTDPASVERIRTLVAPLEWAATVQRVEYSSYDDPNRQMFIALRRALLAGSLFTLLLAGTSLLVLALEHIRERRRPLAILAASGVPTGALARSLLWQIVVPIGVGMVVAVAIGWTLAALVMRLADTTRLVIDWAAVAGMSAAAVVLALLVSVATLPFLRGATRLSSLRTE